MPGNNETPEKFVLRLPRGMRSTIADIAKRQRRSMNAQIVYLLEQLIKQDALENPAKPKQLETTTEE